MMYGVLGVFRRTDVNPSYMPVWVQEFSSDMGSRGVKRIADVGRLRTAQFSQVPI